MSHLKKLIRISHKLCLKALGMILFASCLSPIDFEVGDVSGTVVISGQISTIADQSVIQLGTTANRRFPNPVSGASLLLYDDQGNVSSYYEKYPGIYMIDEAGIPGRTYFIKVTMPDGEVYESMPDKMAEVVGEVSAHYSIVTQNTTDAEGTVTTRPFIKIFCDSNLPKTVDPLFLKWDTEEVYMIVPTDFPDPWGIVPPNCFVTQAAEPQKIVLLNGEEVHATTVTELELATRVIDQSFHTRHYFTIYQSSITREAMEYWRKVNIVANQTGSIFDSPPASITGNLFNSQDESVKVLGYFQTVNQTFSRFYVLPENIPFRLPEYCEYRPFRNIRDYPSECLDCLSVRNSSLVRPKWW